MKKPVGETYRFAPIGFVRTPFRDKFGIPRQPGLASQAKGVIKFNDDPDLKTALRSLDEFSHLWIVFVFHEHGGKNWKPSVRPPRLGGARKVGVLSSRSPHRPNPIGLSAVRLDKIDFEAEGGVEIHVNGVDLLDGTPVLDVKPYLPYADSIPGASSGWASDPIPRFPVHFSSEAEEFLRSQGGDEARDFIVEVLELDPRPAFQKRQMPPQDSRVFGSQFGFELNGLEIKYEIRADGFYVSKIHSIS